MNARALPIADAAVAEARARVHALRRRLERECGQWVQLVETHISWVLLAPALAYKLKKPVELSFLDFGTLAARRRYCEQELRLNRRLAPTLPIDVVDVRDGPQGVHLGGDERDGPVVDVALRMRRFPDGALWRDMLARGALTPAQVDAMAERLAAFHRHAPAAAPGSVYGSPAVHEETLRRLVDGIAALPMDPLEALTDGPALRRWLFAQLRALGPHWERRRLEGRVREGHGDLHLGNVLQLGGEPAAFDGIEFDDKLRWIDPLDDVAFLVMDLLAHDAPALAWRLLDGYLAHSGDYEGLPALRFNLVSRALVRAQATALAPPAGTPGPGDYLALAERLACGGDARLAITRGLPGAGKSFVSLALVEQGGAIRVRSDVERKRLFGLAPLESSRGRVPQGIYDAASNRRTYERLHDAARIALDAGWPVVVDAAFLRRSERDTFAALAASRHAPFAILDCRAAVPVLRRRLAQRLARGIDPSEADAAVLDRLLDVDEPLDRQESERAIVIDAAVPEAAQAGVRRWLQGKAS